MTTIRATEIRKGDTLVKNDGRRFAVAQRSGPEDEITVTVALIPEDGGAIQRVGLLPQSKVEVSR